jgi:hypothetical protein
MESGRVKTPEIDGERKKERKREAERLRRML